MTLLHLAAIGLDRYADPTIPDLRFARGDAQRLVSLFRESSLSAEVRTHTLFDAAATRARVMDLLGVQLPSVVAPDDMVIIYFSGHGSPELALRGDVTSRFLVCHDTQRASLFSTALDVRHDLERVLDRLPARLALFVLDACFSGLTGGRGIIGPRLAELRRTHRPAVRLADLYTGSGAIYLSASADDEVAWEDGTLRHGVFSYHLMENLVAGGGQGTISVGRLYDQTYTAVRQFTHGRQNPMMWGVARGAALPVPLPPPDQQVTRRR